MPSPSPRRKNAPRLIDIAEAAGVGIATVNRALNDSGKVSLHTREKVIQAARQLGAKRLMPEVHRGLTRFDYVFARSQTPFFQRLEIALKRQMQLLDRRIVLHRHDFDPADEKHLAAFIKKPPHRRNGLILVVHDTPLLREAVQSVVKQGVPVVTLMSDLSDVSGLHYAGINNLQAGRSAGLFLGRMAPDAGRVLVLANDLSFRAHRDRSNGFVSALAQRFPQLDCLPVVQTHDDADQAFAAVDRALRVQGAAPLVGIYNSGAASAGVAAALEKLGDRQGHTVVWVGHELSDEHRHFLVDGRMDLVIDQDPDGQILSGMQYLLHANKWVDTLQSRPTEFRLYCAENITQQAYLPQAG